MGRKFIISGGGTGGHIFPALSIAHEIRRRHEDAVILFVGAAGRMEMEKVPAAGFEIMGLPVEGFNRKKLLRNFIVLYKLMRSLCKARKIVRRFKPDVAIGVGGYASGPVLAMAALRNIPLLIQEQNSYAGITNRLLARKAKYICVAYAHMDRYFPSEKIRLTGNPVRGELIKSNATKSEACNFFGLQGDKKILLLLGGSLGAATLNRSICEHLAELKESNVQLIWQTGRLQYSKIMKEYGHLVGPLIKPMDFITRMDLAYACADVIISRAGAGTISELLLVGKPVILVPSPNVAEDHQTRNAQALVNHKAARMVSDSDAPTRLVAEALSLLENESARMHLAAHCSALALPRATDMIVDLIFNLANHP